LNNKKGNITLYVVFIFLGIIIITIGALVGPIGVKFNTEMISAGERILNSTNYNDIQDPAIRASVQDVVTSAQNSAVTNIQVSGGLFQYSWLILLIILLLIIFLYSRQLVEVGGGLI
jgi:hypothetical protein